MAVSGSGSFENPFEGQQPATPGAKKSAANEAVHKKNRQADATFYNPKDPVPVEGSSASAKRSKEEEYLAKQQAKYIQFMEGKMPSREFMASFRGVDATTIEAARAFALPGKAEFMSAAQIERLKAQEKYVRSTQGASAARDFRYKELLGFTEEEIKDIKQFDVPKEKTFAESIRNDLFGGFSAFGIVQNSLAAFNAALREANQGLENFTAAAITGSSPQLKLALSPLRAGLTALPGITAGLGALAGGAIGPGAIVGGATGFLAGGAASAIAMPFTFLAESFDTSVQQLTDSLIGFSPTLTTQAASQQVRRIQRQFERSELLSDRLEGISDARFDFEEALTRFGDRLILEFGPALQKVFTFLTLLLDEGLQTLFDAVFLDFLKSWAVGVIIAAIKAAMWGG